MLANVYIKAFGLDYLWLGVAGELLRWRAMSNGPACDSLFSKT
jgi:hypothetical protein